MKLKNFWFFVLVYKVHPDTFCTNEKDREVLLVAICYGFGGKISAGKYGDDKRDDFFSSTPLCIPQDATG